MDDLSDIPTRQMRVKVLYTFDADSKTTCLARVPGILNIPAVAIDEQTQVGVIELQQCLQSITEASPEILSQLESGDFTIYSTDYSEPDALLVGQGRLSTLLAASSSGTPVQNKTMITGRVLKNSALFSNGVKETLEVKFKLTPLSRPALGSNAEGMRSMSPATSAGFDPNAWNNSVQQNQGQTDYFGFDGMATSGGNGVGMLEDMFGIGTGAITGTPSAIYQQPGSVGVSQTPTDSSFAYNPAFAAQSHSAPGSRSGSPMISVNSNNRNDQLRHQSFSGNAPSFTEHDRPDSRASNRSEYTHQPVFQQQPSQQQQQTEVFYNEEGQSRKRAKVTQTDWRGRSSFGSKSSDLRVTAATASSMHMHRPIAKRPSAPGSNLEPPPRVPTPVPQRTLLPHQRARQSTGPRSMLRQSSIADSDFMSDNDQFSEVAQSSPEGSSPGNSIAGEGTPMEIPSSPPLIPGFNQRRPSSPVLPTLPPPRLADSGYGSDRVFNSGTIIESMEDDENRSPDADDMEVASRYRSRQHRKETVVKTEGSVAGDMSDIRGSEGSKQLYALPAKQASTVSPGIEPTPQPEVSNSRRGSLALPSKPATGAAQTKRKRQPIQRSRTTYNDSEAGSPAPSDNEGARSRGPRSGSGAPRRKIIEQRLADAINNGEAPMYCSHCGAIETPTWRKIYVNHCEGKPSPLDSVEGEGETIAVEVTEIDEDTGDPTKYLIRKSMKKTKTMLPGRGFEETVVCNPCGLWFVKNRKMRPSDRWHRKPNTRKMKRKDDDGLHSDGMEPTSEAFFTDMVAPEDDAMDDADEAPVEPPPMRKLMPKRPRASSMQPQPRRVGDDARPMNVRRDASFMRATQSSPVRFQGSQTSPIELEDTPAKPTRRLLFPSPRREGELKSLEGDNTTTRKSQSPNKSPPHVKAVTISEQTNVNIFEVFTNDQENMPPPFNHDDDLAHLFEGSPITVFKSPASRRNKTPSKTTPQMSNQSHFDELLKTPTSSRKRRALVESKNAANNADASPSSSSRYFLRSTPSRLERTPGGRSSGGRLPVELSPFSRHLSQMLGDATGTTSDPPAFTSPSQQYDFSDLPTFDQVHLEMDWKGMDEILSSEFAVYDDPNAGGVGLGVGRAGGE